MILETIHSPTDVNALKKEATLGTDEEEPEGFFAGILDTLSGEEKKRVQRKAQGEAARETLDALGIGYALEKKESEAAQEVNADGSIVIQMCKWTHIGLIQFPSPLTSIRMVSTSAAMAFFQRFLNIKGMSGVAWICPSIRNISW